MNNLFGEASDLEPSVEEQLDTGIDVPEKKEELSLSNEKDQKIRAIFLDRDNTILDDPGYISEPEQVHLLEEASKALRSMRQMGYKLFVVTNQSGIARGILTEEDFAVVNNRMLELLAEEGASVDGVYYCPYHPDGIVAEYKAESFLRKPNPGMLLKAAEEHNIDLEESWMIGDRYRDVKAGKAANCKTILINMPGKTEKKKSDDPTPDYEAINIKEASNIVMMFHQKQKGRHMVLDIGGGMPEHNEEQTIVEPIPQDNYDIVAAIRKLEKTIIYSSRHQEKGFRKWMVFSGAVQAISVVCVIVALGVLFSKDAQLEKILVPLAFATVFQLMSITAYFLSNAK